MRRLVWLASYPKSGSTWTRAFLAAYGSNAIEALDLKEINRYSRSESRFEDFCQLAGKTRDALTEVEIDALRERVQLRLVDRMPQNCLLKTHNARVQRNGFPLIRAELTRAAVYIVRNPLDIVDSMSDHANLSVDQTIDLLNSRAHQLGGPKSMHVKQYLDSWSRHVESWISATAFPVLVLRYEDLKFSPIDSFRKLILFLKWELDEDRLQCAVAMTDIQSLKAIEDRDGFSELSHVARSQRFFRHGEVGRWKKILSEQQRQSIVDQHGATMIKLGYTI